MRAPCTLLVILLAGCSMVRAQTASSQQSEDMPPPDASQQKAAKTFAARQHVVPKPAAKPATLTPLNPRERVQQLLDRFTFGPRPGEVDRVLTLGADRWLDQQMNPDAIKDDASNKRLADYPTLNMPTTQLIDVFPDRAQIGPVAEGKAPYPTDPFSKAVFEVQVFKWNQEQVKKKTDGTAEQKPELTDADKAALKSKDKANATRVAGELFALPKQQRMAALIQMPVEDRIALTGGGNLDNDQRTLLLAGFTPREAETFRAMGAQVNSAGNIGQELAQARVLRDVLTERQLQEVMTDFWFNHFNIFLPKDSDEWYTTGYERDVIRKNALGNFRDLLLATAKSPAMMVYLDNWLSIGPDWLANGVNPQNPKSKKGNKGLNENYGREVMELHTVGVNGGYTQADVTALAAILTGWGVEKPNQGGPFLFDPKRHEPGPKTWFSYVIDDDGKVIGKSVHTPAPAFVPGQFVATDQSVQQGVTALSILAASPQTAHFLSGLLAQHFVADTPPPALVDRLAKVYLASHGDIKTVLRALIASPEFNSRQYFHNKVKTPVEFVATAFRATATEPQNPGALVDTLRSMGMPLYYALAPTGYYLSADQWMNSTALIDRPNFAYSLTTGKYANQKFDASKLLATGLLLSSTPQAGSLPVGAAPSGTQTAMRVLETTLIGVPVSAETNQLIEKQLQQQTTSATPVDTLNLLTALVMGSPEFQFR